MEQHVETDGNASRRRRLLNGRALMAGVVGLALTRLAPVVATKARHVGVRARARFDALRGGAQAQTPGSCRTLEALYPLEQSDIADKLAQALASGSGVCVVAGPTGTGKTTTVAAMLRHAAVFNRKVVSLEDPVEVLIPGVQQISLDDPSVSFSDVARSVLRCDTDVVMIGELRDEETARFAVEAAQAGCLVLTTVHSRGAADAPQEILKLGAESTQLADVLRIVVGQRLVNRLCSACSDHGQPQGCPQCGDGWAGRVVVGETLTFNAEAREIVMFGASPEELQRTAGYISFSEHAQRLLASAQTTETELDETFGSVQVGGGGVCT